MTATQSADAARTTDSLRVLIVDDDRDQAEGLVDLLEPRGYQLAVAHDLDEARRRLAEFDVQVALIDVRLGTASGNDLLREIVQSYPATLCVMIAASADLDNVIESFQQGAFDFLRKPLSPASLFVSLERCAGRIRLHRERTKTEQALRESEERFRTLFENAPLGYQSLDINGNVIELNETWCKLLGYTKEEVLGRNFSEFIHPDFREHFKENFPKFKSMGYILGVEFEMIRKDGSEIIVAFDGKIGHHDDGSFKQTHCVLSDVTKRKQAEEALLSEKLLSDEYINSLPGLFYVFDEERFVRWNKRWEKVTGYNSQELGAKYGTDFFEGQDKVLIGERMLEVFREGSSEAEAELVTKDGRRIPYYFTGLRKVFDGKDHLVGLGLDITDRKRAEREREELIAKLEAQNAELERFTYTVSHDLKSPLITIQGYVGVLRKDLAEGDAETAENDLVRISHAADKMDQLLRELLELSRIGRLINPPEAVPLDDLARDAVELVSGQAKQNRVRIEISPDLPVVFGDRVRLREVLQNLIDNAVKYMGDQPEPRVEVGSRSDGGQTVCYVRDNGIGIESRYHERVFRLFDQLDQKVEGSGIGLALVRRIIEVHGGRVWIESEGPGHGATFCFTVAAKSESTQGPAH